MARGTIITMKVPIITAVRICRRYCRNAVSEPTWICPAPTRWPPNHSTAAVARCRIMVMTGNISTNREPMRTDTSVSSRLAAAKRRRSWSSRTKARTTRMPTICSRSTALIRSIRPCMSRKRGMSRPTSTPTAIPSTGTDTHTSQESPASSRRAITIPPAHMMGAATMKLSPMSTSIWICWTSLVPRVMRVGAPKPLTSREPKEPTCRCTARRRSRPVPIAARAAQYTAATAAATCRSATPSITSPTRRIRPVSPRTTPSSMIRALRLGSSSAAIVATSWSATTARTHGR
jgi:hypothetical protein